MQDSEAPSELEGHSVVGHVHEIGPSNAKEFRIGDGDWPLRVFVVRDGDTYFAYRNVCPHAGMALDWKPDHFLTKDGAAIICASHGALFDKTTGECIAGPCAGRALTAYPVIVADDGRIAICRSGILPRRRP